MWAGPTVASAVALFVAGLLHLLHVPVCDIWADFNKPGLGSKITTSIVSKHLVYHERNMLIQQEYL